MVLKKAFLSAFKLISGKNICQNDANIQPNEDRCQNAKNDGIFLVALIKEITRSMQVVTKISPSILSPQRVHQLKYSEWSSPNTLHFVSRVFAIVKATWYDGWQITNLFQAVAPNLLSYGSNTGWNMAIPLTLL